MSTQSEVTLQDVIFSNITSTDTIELLLFTSDSAVTGSKVSYTDSNATFIVCLYSMFSFEGLNVSRVQISGELIYLREVQNQVITKNGTIIFSSLSNSHIELTALTPTAKMRLVRSEFNSIRNVTFFNIDAVALRLDTTTVSSIAYLNTTKVNQALYMFRSQVGLVDNSTFTA